MRERRSIRFPDHDYTSPGLYFVTVCLKGRRNLLGCVGDEGIVLTRFGRIAESFWWEIPEHFPNVELDEFVVMPNHIHGIIGIMEVGPLSAVTKKINLLCGTPGAGFWQRNYYEHLIRNPSGAERVRDYIRNNPARWQVDRENPGRTGDDEFDLWLESFSKKHRVEQEAPNALP